MSTCFALCDRLCQNVLAFAYAVLCHRFLDEASQLTPFAVQAGANPIRRPKSFCLHLHISTCLTSTLSTFCFPHAGRSVTQLFLQNLAKPTNPLFSQGCGELLNIHSALAPANKQRQTQVALLPSSYVSCDEASIILLNPSTFYQRFNF